MWFDVPGMVVLKEKSRQLLEVCDVLDMVGG